MPTWNGSSYSRNSDNSSTACLVVGIIVAIVLAFVLISSYASVKSYDNLKITGKESVNTGDGHEYRIYTDQGTFVAKDSIVHPRFDTSDFYGRLEIGKTYDCTAYGWRVPIASVFKNLQNCKEVQ